MGANWSRFQSLGNLAFMLRMAADTLRLFSDTKKRGGSYMSPVTRISLQVDESADALDDVARDEVEKADGRGSDAA